MNAPPFVTFLSTAYQTEQYVPQMIESVLAQTDPDWELVIVDNGRLDSMADVIGRYTGDPRIRLLRQENRGVIGGFEAATSQATGTYVVPLSSDDEVVPAYVARMRELLTEHPEAVGVMCDAHLFSDGHEQSFQRGLARSIGSRPARGTGEWLTKRDLFSGRLPYYCGVFLRSVWNDVGGYSTRDDTVDENIDLLLRVTDSGPIFVVSERLGRYRLRDDSLTRHSSSIEAFERRVINSYQVYGEQAGPEDRALARRTVRRIVNLQSLRRAREAFVEGNVDLARRESKTAWRQRRTVRSFGIMVSLHVAPGLLGMLHPAKRRATEWMLVHSPIDWIRTRTIHGSPRSVSRGVRGASAGGTQPVAEASPSADTAVDEAANDGQL